MTIFGDQTLLLVFHGAAKFILSGLQQRLSQRTGSLLNQNGLHGQEQQQTAETRNITSKVVFTMGFTNGNAMVAFASTLCCAIWWSFCIVQFSGCPLWTVHRACNAHFCTPASETTPCQHMGPRDVIPQEIGTQQLSRRSHPQTAQSSALMARRSGIQAR